MIFVRQQQRAKIVHQFKTPSEGLTRATCRRFAHEKAIENCDIYVVLASISARNSIITFIKEYSAPNLHENREVELLKKYLLINLGTKEKTCQI